jgi:hypothetical protein
MSAPGLEVAAHGPIRDPLPFQARDERTGHGVQLTEDVRKRLRGRVFHREHADADVVDLEVVAVALDRGIRHIEVEMRVVFQRRAVAL